tara:strand:+ start:456 stop:1457 length:1002 start_codon:yes stop_codon:yes gene_type:complete
MEKTRKLLVGNPNQLEVDQQIGEDELTYVVMNLPFGCNYSCSKCYREDNKSEEDIDLQTRLDVISEAKDLGARVLCIPGEGEPLTDRNLTMQLVDHAQALGLVSVLYTNASFLNPETIQDLFDRKVTLITAVDSLKPETYQQLTGFQGLERVRKNLDTLREIYRPGNKTREDGSIETRWGVITIINQHNKDEVPGIKEFCGDDAFYICNYPINKGGATSVWDSYVGTEEDLKGLIRIANIYTDTLAAGLSAPIKSGQYIMLNHGITIDTNGNTHACPAMVDTNLGNIADTTVEEIWRKTKEYTRDKDNPLCLARDIRQYCKKANVLSVGEMLV